MKTYTERLIEVLEQSKALGRLIGYSPWEDGKDSFLAGYVKSISAKKVVISKVASTGQSDGEEEYALKDIGRFHFDGDYLRKLQAFHENLDEAITDPVLIPFHIPKNGWHYLDFLRTLVGSGRIVTLVDESHDRIMGYVNEVGDDYVEIAMVDEDNGMPDGYEIWEGNDIHSISCGSRREMEIEYLVRLISSNPLDSSQEG